MTRIAALESLELLAASQKRLKRAAGRILSIAHSRAQPRGEVRSIDRREG